MAPNWPRGTKRRMKLSSSKLWMWGNRWFGLRNYVIPILESLVHNLETGHDNDESGSRSEINLQSSFNALGNLHSLLVGAFDLSYVSVETVYRAMNDDNIFKDDILESLY